MANGINTAMPLSRKTPARIGPSHTRCHGWRCAADRVMTVRRISSVISASGLPLRPAWRWRKPKVVDRTRLASSATVGPNRRRVQIWSASTVSHAAAADTIRSATRLTPNTAKLAAISQTFRGGLLL